jgi:4-methylaminobutanoate oxidase (formaldehyde-forming)
MISGAATRWRDLRWLRRQLGDGEQVSVRDMSEGYAVLGVMGPRSRDLLQLTPDVDFSATAFSFGTSQEIVVAGEPVVACRVSFVGELGWELYIPAVSARRVYRRLAEAGEGLGFRHAGHYCVDGCRLEKGFRHWGHDIGPDVTPIEAGLSFAVSFDKKGGFIGRDALLRQREAGLRRRLVLFAVEGGNPLLLHDEPIYRDGRLVGMTTSGNRGWRTGLSLCFGTISCHPEEALQDMLSAQYEVAVAGQRLPLRALKRPPYDPDGQRMRS